MIEKHESMFKCKVCGKTVKWKGEMKKHAETHIEGIFHACQVCSKMFPTRHNLQTHIFRIHSELFSCNVCGKTGMNKLGSTPVSNSIFQVHFGLSYEKNNFSSG